METLLLDHACSVLVIHSKQALKQCLSQSQSVEMGPDSSHFQIFPSHAMCVEMSLSAHVSLRLKADGGST